MVQSNTGKVLFESHKYEVPLTEHEKNPNLVSPFNSHSHAGDVTVSTRNIFFLTFKT
jgi:hypothetical protein